MKEWPSDNEPVHFEDLVAPLAIAMRHAYNLERKELCDIPYNGYDIGSRDLACCLSIPARLKAEQLRYAHEEQGRDALTEILSMAVQLGIEQGRRVDNNARKVEDLMRQALEAKVARLEALLEKGSDLEAQVARLEDLLEKGSDA